MDKEMRRLESSGFPGLNYLQNQSATKFRTYGNLVILPGSLKENPFLRTLLVKTVQENLKYFRKAFGENL